MEIFGKNIELEIDDKQEEIIIYSVIAILTIVFMYLLIIKPSLKIKRNKEFYKSEIQRHETITEKLSQTKEKHLFQVKKYEEQRDNYEELITKMNNASLQNNAILKQVVQRIMDESKVEMVSIGALESGGNIVGESYEKRFIPYTVVGKGRNLTKLFYFLENSEWLITLKGSIINLKRNGSGPTEQVNAQFKLGAYYPKEIKEEKEEKVDE